MKVIESYLPIDKKNEAYKYSLCISYILWVRCKVLYGFGVRLDYFLTDDIDGYIEEYIVCKEV